MTFFIVSDAPRHALEGVIKGSGTPAESIAGLADELRQARTALDERKAAIVHLRAENDALSRKYAILHAEVGQAADRAKKFERLSNELLAEKEQYRKECNRLAAAKYSAEEAASKYSAEALDAGRDLEAARKVVAEANKASASWKHHADEIERRLGDRIKSLVGANRKLAATVRVLSKAPTKTKVHKRPKAKPVHKKK